MGIYMDLDTTPDADCLSCILKMYIRRILTLGIDVSAEM